MAKNSWQKKPKISEILVTKVVHFSCCTKLIKTKKLLLYCYSSMNFFLERFEGFLTLKINFENQILALFDVYFWPFNKSHEKINIIFVISAIIASIWNVFIKFRWHDEKLTYGTNETLESKVHWWLVWGRSQKKNWKPHLCTYLDLDDLIHLVYLIDPWTPLNPPEPCWRYEIRGFASPSRIVLISADLHCYVKRL